eukprot:823460-Prorocentrum_minimum.AAC.2
MRQPRKAFAHVIRSATPKNHKLGVKGAHKENAPDIRPNLQAVHELVRDSLLDEDFVSAAGAVEALSASGGSLSREGFNLRKRFLPTIAAVELEGMTMGLELLFRLAHEVIRPVNLGRGWMHYDEVPRWCFVIYVCYTQLGFNSGSSKLHEYKDGCVAMASRFARHPQDRAQCGSRLYYYTWYQATNLRSPICRTNDAPKHGLRVWVDTAQMGCLFRKRGWGKSGREFTSTVALLCQSPKPGCRT